MIDIALFQSWISIPVTATTDAPFNTISVDKWFSEGVVLVLTKDAFFGDVTSQEIPLGIGESYNFENPTNIREFMFKNRNAGDNCKILVSGNPMTKDQIKRAGVK